jgi:hypothetical protein
MHIPEGQYDLKEFCRVIFDSPESVLEGYRGQRIKYTPEGEYGREWLASLCADLADDELVDIEDSGEETIVRLGGERAQ